MPRSSEWLTGVRLQRMAHALVLIPSLSQEISARHFEQTLWRKCGGPLAEIPALVRLLSDLKLARCDHEIVKRTPAGDKVAKALKQNDDHPLNLTLIRAGRFHSQARVLIECGRVDDAGNLRCPTRLAQTGAPQLLGILQSWDNVQLYPEILIPHALVEELNTVWALMPPDVEVPKWAAERRAIGDRAEMYSLQYERTRIGPSLVIWVSRDSDAFGYDIEDRSQVPYRCVEVKGSRETEVLFYLSENEWRKAQELGDRYEIHFWGGINLSEDPGVEYADLRTAGYPFVIRNPAVEIAAKWQVTPVKWRISIAQISAGNSSS